MVKAANVRVLCLAGSPGQDLAKQASYDQGESDEPRDGGTGWSWLFYHVSTWGEERDRDEIRLLVTKLDPQGPRGCESDKGRLRRQPGDDSGSGPR